MGNISNCYAHGSIKSDNSNLGGIAGKTKGNVKNNFSFVNISSSSDNIGGIVGNNSTGNNYYVEKIWQLEIYIAHQVLKILEIYPEI